MRKKPKTTVSKPRAVWVADARRLRPLLDGGVRPFRWRSPVLPLKRVFRAAMAAVLLAVAAQSARAAFDAPAISAQAAAMGGASLAGQGGDSAALFFNPAAGAGLASPEAYFTYDQLYAGLSGVGGLSQGFAAFAESTKLGTLGLGLSDFQASGLLDERVVGATFARRWFDGVEIGVTGKYLYHRYLVGSDPSAASDPVFSNGTARGAFAADVGAIVPVSDDLHVGLAVRNLNQPNVGLASVDRVPRQIQAGLVYDWRPYALRLTADYTYDGEQAATLSQQSQPSVGVEKSLERGMVKFRAGLTPNQLSAGVGITLGPVGFDYTFLLNRALLSNNAGTHEIGLRYRFGDAAPPSSRSQ